MGTTMVCPCSPKIQKFPIFAHMEGGRVNNIISKIP